jgi:hypothetical protein
MRLRPMLAALMCSLLVGTTSLAADASTLTTGSTVLNRDDLDTGQSS